MVSYIHQENEIPFVILVRYDYRIKKCGAHTRMLVETNEVAPAQ
jgi:hypothetical protein